MNTPMGTEAAPVAAPLKLGRNHGFMRKGVLKIITDSYAILLATFIATFFVVNEHFDLSLGPKIILPILVLLAAGFIAWQRKAAVSDYIVLPVIFVDGYFHLTSPLENLVANSPDWVIALNLYQGHGMPIIVHQIMGVFLLLTSGWFTYLLILKKKNWSYYFYKYAIALITLTIISFSYLIKLSK
ncbi:MAG: hypothetical protein HY983_02415 [Candidatus Magasanikbacteria bacterium]|nr:hypothetical protein [Candidatus Magasanikbacteria bacterium]